MRRALRAGSCAALLVALLIASPAGAQGLFSASWASGASAELSVPLRTLARPLSHLAINLYITTTEPLEGVVEVRLGDDQPPVRRAVSVGRGATHRVSVPVRLGGWAATPRVTIRDARGRFVRIDPGPLDQSDAVDDGGRGDERAQDTPRPTAVPLTGFSFDVDALHVAVLGEEPLGWTALREMDGNAPIDGHLTAVGGVREIAVASVLPTEAPTAWYGWDPVDIVVWRSPDPARLTPEQTTALLGFVARGGTLIVSLDATYGSFGAGRFGAAIGADLRGAESLPVLDALSMRMQPTQPAVASGEELVVVGADPHPGTDVRLAVGAHPLVLERRLGGGRLLLLTFDVGSPRIQSRIGTERFWRRLLGANEWLGDALGEGETPDFHSLGVAAVAPVVAPVTGDLTPGGWRTALYGVLEDFGGLNPLPLGFLIAFGLLYLLFIGPLDYLLVRRLERPVLTWLTFPAMALGFSVVVVAVVAVGRTGGSAVRCLEIVDEIPEMGSAAGSTFCSYWAGGREDLLVAPGAVSGWVRPSEAVDDWGYYGVEVETFEELVVVADGRAAGLTLRTAPWSLSRFEGAWFGEGAGGGTLGFERAPGGLHELFRVDRAGPSLFHPSSGRTPPFAGRLPVVTNQSAHSLERAWLVFADTTWSLGPLAPGEAAPVPDVEGEDWQAAHQGRFAGDLFELAVAPHVVGHRVAGAAGGPLLVGWTGPLHVPGFTGDVAPAPRTDTLVRIPLAVDRGGLR